MRKFFNFSWIFMLSAFLSGCGMVTGLNIDDCVSKYRNASAQISLGDSKDRVLSILSPTQKNLPSGSQKSSDQLYGENGEIIEIIYFRSGRTPDGMTTDDEFTPYVFQDGKLIAIGWAALGGPNTKGRIPDQININQTVIH